MRSMIKISEYADWARSN